MCSFSVSQYESEIKTEKERELKAPFILSFNDPEVDALVHRKFKNYVHEENPTDTVIHQESSVQQSRMSEVGIFNIFREDLNLSE